MKMILLVMQILYISGCAFAQDDNYLKFPEGFSIGAATSACQVEGAWNISDKSESVWDHRIHANPSLFNNGDNADIACDPYHQYRKDVQLVRNIGLNHYRFSISWSRVLPNGSADRISKDGIQYYKNLIDEVLNNGIEPFVTLHDSDDVQSLFDKTGGWANESMVEYFAEYARVMFRELGSKVKFWSTINEIDVYCKYYAYLNETAPNTAYTARYLCAHNLLKAHARAYHIYNGEFRPTQQGRIGLVFNSGYYIPNSVNDTESTNIAFAFEAGWIMDPIFSKHGGYPEIMKQRIAENSEAEGLTHSRLPEFSSHWINYIKGSSDYLGLNHYVTIMVEPVNKTNRRWYDDEGITESVNPDWRLTATGLGVVPESIGALLRKIRDTYDNPPVYIMENGASECSDLIDLDRIEYLYSYMTEVLLANRDGCDVRAYTIWSLMDSFEYYDGYSRPWGLVHVDFKDPNRTRTPKLSSYWLETVMDQRKLLPFNDTMLHAMKFK